MPRKKFSDKRRATLTDGQLAFLRTGVWVRGDAEIYFFKTDPEKLASAWSEVGVDLVAEHVKKFPGSRPWGWWKFDAPETRQRLGGRGTLRDPDRPVLDFGMPSRGYNWIIPADVRVGIKAIPVDFSNPPVFESQATFLRRNGLLVSGEERRIPTAAWEPEAVVFEASS
jgi:hypothetical protein